MSTLILPSQRRDVFPQFAPHLEAVNTRHRWEEPPKHTGGFYRHPEGFVPAQVRQLQLPIRPVPLAGKIPQPVPLQLRPGANPYPDRRSSRMTNISTKSSPELRRSAHQSRLGQDGQSGTTSVATIRNGPAHGQPEFRPVSIYDSTPIPFALTQRVRTSSNPVPAQRPTSSASSATSAGAWASSSSEVPNFSRKIPVKPAVGAPSASRTNSWIPLEAGTSQQLNEKSPPRTSSYKPVTSSPLSRPKSTADLRARKSSISDTPPPPRMPPLNRPPSSAVSIRAEDEWRTAANVPAFSRDALKNNSIIMPLKASDIMRSKEKEQNLRRLKRGSKSTTDLRSSARSTQTSPRKSGLVVTNPDVVDIARKIPFERPPSCLRNSISSSHSPQSKVPKKVRIADDPLPQLHAIEDDGDSLIDLKATLESISRIGSSLDSPPIASSTVATPKYVRRRSNSLPNAGAMMQKKDAQKMSDWLESSSDELKKFLCPSPSPPSSSPASSPPRPRATPAAEKAMVPAKPVPLLRLSKSGSELKVELNRSPVPTLPKLDTHVRSGSSGPSYRARLPSPMFSTFSMERANSGVTSSSSSSNDTCFTDRSLVTIASSKTSIESTTSRLKPSSSKPPEKTSAVQLPPPPKSSADLWRQSDDGAKVQQPRTVIPQAPARNPPIDVRRKDNKPEDRPSFVTKLVCGFGFGSRKASETKRVRCNCGTTTVNLHYKKYHTSNGDGAGLL